MHQIRRMMLVLFAMMLFILPAAADEPNLLVNGSFESLGADGLPSGWKTESYRNMTGVSMYDVTADAWDGSNAAVVHNADFEDARFAQTVKVEPDSMYRLSGYIRVDEKIVDSGRGANLSVSGVHSYTESVYDADGEWHYVEVYGETGPEQTELTVYARIGGYSRESLGRASFDNLSLVRVDALPGDAVADLWFQIPVSQNISNNTSEDGEDETPAAFWPWLLVISACYAAAAAWLMRWIQLSQQEDRLGGKKRSQVPAFVVIGLIIAGIVRIVIALNVEGYGVDVGCFTAWGSYMLKDGPSLFYGLNGDYALHEAAGANFCDYPPAYLYVMGFNAMLVKLFNGSVSAAFVHKLIPMLCDLLGACLVYRIAADHGCSRRQAGMLSLLVAFNPAVILNSAAWCQIDSVLCVGLMLVAYLAIRRKWLVLMPVYVLCVLIKPQALMLGFLGLAAIVLELIRQPQVWKQMAIGAGIALIMAVVIILPFCFNQSEFFWMINLYKDTLASYPHATVNTTNLYYLFDANWDGIANPAATGAIIFFLMFSIAWCVYHILTRKERKLALLEPVLMGMFAAAYGVMLFFDTPWTVLGIASMAMAFAMVLPMFVRNGKLENLPLCGAVIFILLYVFGIKMHERYLFPALFLLGMAYGIRRDRRLLLLMVGFSACVFINEGIILDNDLRLEGNTGHLLQDTVALAKMVSLAEVIMALLSLWTCHRICLDEAQIRLDDQLPLSRLPVREYDARPTNALNFRDNSGLGWKPLDTILMSVVTVIYAIVTLTTLGSTKAPQTAWKSSARNEQVIVDLGQHYENFSMLYYCQVSYNDFTVAVSDDKLTWSEEYWAEMNQAQCFRWKYLVPSTSYDGKVNYIGASNFDAVKKLSGRYVRISPNQVNLAINELVFLDAEGRQIFAVSAEASGANTMSPLYSDPDRLLDEQNSLDGEPGWWNSTYFDEIYHARTAFEHMEGTVPYETSHPPLGKVIMSWCVSIFGMTPFGWRFAGAMCGVLMLPAIYLLAKQMTKRTEMAFAAIMLMSLDCMHFAQTRIATIDSFPVLFIILSYFFMLRFMQRDIVRQPVRKLLPDLALCGFFMGCGIASKWIGVYAGAGLAVLYFWTCFRHLSMAIEAARMLREGEYTPEERAILKLRDESAFRRVIVLCLWCLLFFVLVPVVIYLLSYIPYYAYMDFVSEDALAEIAQTASTGIGVFKAAFDWIKLHANAVKEYLELVIDAQEGMFSYHATPGLGMDHPFYSPWYEWPLNQRPMYYASPAFVPQGWSYAIFCFGNPAVWYVGLVGIAFVLINWAYHHRYRIRGGQTTLQVYADTWNVNPGFVLIGLLAQFLPWVLVPRGTYIYHYFASTPFLILGTVLLLDAMMKRWNRGGMVVMGVYLLICLVLFILLFPYASGVLTPVSWLEFIKDYPWVDAYGQNSNAFLSWLHDVMLKIPLFPNVYF